MEALRSVSRLLFGPAPPGPAPSRPRPFWVSPAPGGEGRPRGVLAASLGELRQQPPALALAEDGTLVEDEEFFGTLPPHTALQALGEGQRWEPPESPPGFAPLLVPSPAPPELVRPNALIRELLRLLASLCGALGWALLGVSAALRPLLEGPQTHRERH
ncbi:lipid transferase CIDEB-like [Ammospiza caudacuta]|uniref:lipid transferase CIDEB-like n=1 Tax=Ammospiza caudacuta TaxID=2857398 RepID=UPI002738B0EB|nr:lipid transferase CIDEB-like [Ammospiza caudacuta]